MNFKIEVNYEKCRLGCRDCAKACKVSALEKWFDTLQYSSNICEHDYCMEECVTACKYYALKIVEVEI